MVWTKNEMRTWMFYHYFVFSFIWNEWKDHIWQRSANWKWGDREKSKLNIYLVYAEDLNLNQLENNFAFILLLLLYFKLKIFLYILSWDKVVNNCKIVCMFSDLEILFNWRVTNKVNPMNSTKKKWQNSRFWPIYCTGVFFLLVRCLFL